MAKENLAVASALGIGIASLITSIVIETRTTATKGAQALGSFAQPVKKAISKLDPCPVPLANFLTSGI